MDYTTEYCKEFLVNMYKQTVKNDWKRIRKYKDVDGLVMRDFKCDKYNLKETLVETPFGMLTQTEYLQQSQKNTHSNLINNVGMANFLFGGGLKSNQSVVGDLNKFLNVLDYGIDWQAKENERSAYYFSKKINFNQEVLNHPDILKKLISYTNICVSMFLDMDETYMPHHCSKNDFDDSLPDLIELIKVVKLAYENNNLSLDVEHSDVSEIISILDDVNNMMSEEPVILQSAEKKIDEMKKLLKTLNEV